jgi:2-polyprenyl-3-methyl-5-hydroxy-6-metoxy-1,4-benzoquinol methylase
MLKETWNKQFLAGSWNHLDSAPIEKTRHALIAMYATHYFPEGKILDVGCGLGTLQDFLSGPQKNNYTGLDVSDVAINMARAKPGKFISGDASCFTTSETFQVIVFNEVLYYVDFEAIIGRFLGFLAEDGLLIVSMCKSEKSTPGLRAWEYLDKHFRTVESVALTGTTLAKLITWEIKVLAPLPAPDRDQQR